MTPFVDLCDFAFGKKQGSYFFIFLFCCHFHYYDFECFVDAYRYEVSKNGSIIFATSVKFYSR